MMEGADYSSNNTIPEENESTASQSTPKTKPAPDEQGTNKSERASQKTNSSVKETADDSDKKSTTSRTSKNSADQNNDKQSVTKGNNSVVSERKLTISTIQREGSLVDPKEYEEAERVSKNTPKRSVENSVVYKPDQITDAKALSDRISLINPFSNDIPLPISFIMEPHTSTPLGNTQNPFNMFEMPPSVNNGAMSYRSAHYSDRPPTYLSDPTFARQTYGTMAVPTPNPYNYFPNNYSVVDTFSRRLSDPRLTAPAPTPLGLPGFPYPEVMFPGSLSLPAPSTNSENQSTTKKKKKKKKRRRFECLDDDGVYLPHTSIKKAKWRDVWDNLEISLMKKRKALEKAYKKLASAECHYIGDSAKHSKNRSHKCCLNGDTIPLCCHACPASRHPREYRQGEAPLEGRLYCSGYVPSDMANEKCYRLLPCEDNYEQEERQEKRRPSNATFVSFRSKTDNRGDANQNDLQDFQPYEEDEVVYRNNSVQYEGDDIPRQSLGASNLGFNNRDSVNYEQRSRPSRLENTSKKSFSNYNFEPNNRFSFSKSDHQRNSKQDHNSKDAGLPCEESVTEVNATLLRSIQVSLRSKKRNQCKTKKFNLDVDSAKVLRSLLCQSDSSPGLCTEQETTPGKKCPCANFAASCDAPWYCFPPSSKYAQCCRSSYQGTSQRKKPNACNANDIFTSPTPFSCANIPDSIQARHLKRLMSHFYHDLVSLPARPDEDENDDDDGEDKENACSQHESFSCNTNRSNTVVVNAENLQTCAELHFLKRNSSTDREIERYIFEKEILTPLKINSRKKSSSKSLEDELDFLDFVRSERFIEECRKVSSGGSFSKKSSFSSRKSSKRNSTAGRSQNETCVKNSIPCVKTLVDTGIQSCCMEEDPCCVPPTNDPCTKPPDPCNKMSCVSVTSSGVDKCKPTRPPRRRSVEEKVCLCPGEAVVCARNSDTACTRSVTSAHRTEPVTGPAKPVHRTVRLAGSVRSAHKTVPVTGNARPAQKTVLLAGSVRSAHKRNLVSRTVTRAKKRQRVGVARTRNTPYVLAEPMSVSRVAERKPLSVANAVVPTVCVQMVLAARRKRAGKIRHQCPVAAAQVRSVLNIKARPHVKDRTSNNASHGNVSVVPRVVSLNKRRARKIALHHVNKHHALQIHILAHQRANKNAILYAIHPHVLKIYVRAKRNAKKNAIRYAINHHALQIHVRAKQNAIHYAIHPHAWQIHVRAMIIHAAPPARLKD
ncbi:uncharacterized protein LOC131952195 [Physella acuta]|uniref:uncharacterized protein LOC131952195 n=1 Tax=Physella acuta TaxID=109671 RepID=UPI0027DADA51|nr:uncharacterized protein LOC131952195 [Physella acuta]